MSADRRLFRVPTLLLRHWFVWCLLAAAALVLWNPGEGVVQAGIWLKSHRAPEVVICSIFFLSGLRLSVTDVLRGASDLPAILMSLGIIFLVAPLLGWGLIRLPFSEGLAIGLILVAAMPTTLSTGVVMTGAAGGNEATALAITMVANALGVLTVPITLEILLGSGVALPPGAIDKGTLAFRIAGLVVAPLGLGLALRSAVLPLLGSSARRLPVVNQWLVLGMISIALAGSRGALVARPQALAPALAVSALYHGLVWGAIAVLLKLFPLGPRRREAVIFMGGQKTLPLAVLLQTTLFPAHAEALVLCVVHHLVHLVMDGYLAERLRPLPTNSGRLPP